MEVNSSASASSCEKFEVGPPGLGLLQSILHSASSCKKFDSAFEGSQVLVGMQRSRLLPDSRDLRIAQAASRIQVGTLQRAGRESRRCSDACSTRLMPQCQEFEDMRNQLTNQPNVSSRFSVITRNSFLSHSSSFVLCSRQRWYRRSGRVASSADPARATW